MSYVERNLIAGERVLYITGLHSIVLFWPIVFGVLFGLPAIMLLIASIADNSGDAAPLAIVGLIMLIGAGLSVLAGVISKKATEMAVTNRRVIVKVGLLSRRSYEILLPKIESIGIEEGVLGRILGYGSVVVRGTGGIPEPFHNIRLPSQFRRQVQGQVDASQPNSSR